MSLSRFEWRIGRIESYLVWLHFPTSIPIRSIWNRFSGSGIKLAQLIHLSNADFLIRINIDSPCVDIRAALTMSYEQPFHLVKIDWTS